MLIVLFLLSTVFALPQAKSTPGPPAQGEPVAAPSSPKEAPKTLRAFKSQFLNQDVIIKDSVFDEKYCLEWATAKEMPDGTYKKYWSETDPHDNLPIGYKGQTATVVAVSVSAVQLRANVGGTNAFGDSVSQEDVEGLFIEVVVKFKDGTLAMDSNLPQGFVPRLMELVSARQAATEGMESKLPSVIGRKLYAVGYSRLYKLTARIEDLDSTNEILERLPESDVPRLEPLTIIGAKYVPDVDGVVMKLRLPNGTEAIAYTASTFLHEDLASEGGAKDEFITKVAGLLVTAIPVSLTRKEIDAIKGMKLYRGMRKQVLDYAIGFCEKENDWGRGGKQRVYFGGKLLVYLDNSEKVEDWQSVE
jgi:hypothetical protein